MISLVHSSTRKRLFFNLLSLMCAAGVFYLSFAFQAMAYWSDGLTWYWIGAVFTYLAGLLGAMFAFLSLIKRGGEKPISVIILLNVVSFIALGLGFVWTTFVIIAGQSGM